MLLTLPACRIWAERRASRTADCQPAVTPGSHHVLQALCVMPLRTAVTLQALTVASVATRSQFCLWQQLAQSSCRPSEKSLYLKKSLITKSLPTFIFKHCLEL